MIDQIKEKCLEALNILYSNNNNEKLRQEANKFLISIQDKEDSIQLGIEIMKSGRREIEYFFAIQIIHYNILYKWKKLMGENTQLRIQLISYLLERLLTFPPNHLISTKIMVAICDLCLILGLKKNYQQKSFCFFFSTSSF